MNKKTLAVPALALSLVAGTACVTSYAHAQQNDSAHYTSEEDIVVDFPTEKKDLLADIDTEVQMLTELRKNIENTKNEKDLEKVMTENEDFFADTEESASLAGNDESVVDADFEAQTKKINSIISEKEWQTLTLKQIDEKLKKAGIENFIDENDPFYNMTTQEIDKLTDAEWDKIDNHYAEQS